MAEDVYAQVADVEQFLRSRLASDMPLLQEVCDYAFEAGGKRLRPCLALVSGAMFGAPLESLLRAAAAVEMIHTATLLHDDIMDASPTRRGRATVTRQWDAVTAVYAGDYILSRAFTLLSEYGRADILNVFSGVTSRLCEGEILQARNRRRLDVTTEECLTVIDCKTAHFLACCCRVGGMVAGAPPEALAALSAYGTQIGLVFQITDDLLDYLGDTEKTGKDVGADFREGKYTLPVLMALHSGHPEAARLRELLASEDRSNDAFRAVRACVLAAGGEKEAAAFADECTQSAIAALSELPAGPPRDALQYFAEWIARRST